MAARMQSRESKQNKQERIWTMRRRMIVLLIFLMLLGGCARTSVFVLNKEELVRVKKGQNITVEYDGWVLSDRAVDRVLNAKIKAVNLQ